MNLSYLDTILRDQPKYRLLQIEEAIYRDLITNWNKATTLPLKLREELAQKCSLDIEAEVFESEDKKTIRALITLEDGEKIESVLMKHRDRYTVCVSSQVGCSLRCNFCATGMAGFKRNLTELEIVEQAIFFSRYIKNKYKPEDRVTNIVFMGMGEPFLNYDNVMKAVYILNNEKKFNIGARKISISTSGLIDGIEKLSNENIQVNLAVSLNATNNKIRSKLMPINKRYDIEDLLKATKEYINKTSRQVMIEYILIRDINDNPIFAKELAEKLSGGLYMVNLIACNPVGDFKPPSMKVIEEFARVLEENGIKITQRYKFGRSIDAACGQLSRSTRRNK